MKKLILGVPEKVINHGKWILNSEETMREIAFPIAPQLSSR